MSFTRLRDSSPVNAPVNRARSRQPGVRAFFDLTLGLELITGRPPVGFNSAGVFPKHSGKGGYDFSNQANVQWAHHPNFVLLGTGFVFFKMDLDAISNFGAIISKQNTTTTQCPYEIRMGRTAGDSNIHITRSNTTNKSYDTNINRVSAGAQSVVIGIRFNAAAVDTAPDVFIAGAKVAAGTSSGTGTGAPTDDGSSLVCIGRRAAGTTYLDGRIYWVALGDYAPSDEQMLAWLRYPDQLRPPDVRTLFYGAASGPVTFKSAWARAANSAWAGGRNAA